MTEAPTPVLTIIVTEIGREASESPNFGHRSRTDLADIRAWRFFDAAPEEFFRQYAQDFIIDHVHVAPESVQKGATLLAERKLTSLTMAGHMAAFQIEALRNMARDKDFLLQVERLPASRAMSLESNQLLWHSSPEVALAVAGLNTHAATPAAASIQWTAWFRRFYADEVLPVLRVRHAGTFFQFMKTLTDASATGLNWAGLGEKCGISGPSVRDWCLFLTESGVIDLVAPMPAPAPRRAKMRPKLYWNAPGLALWLTDAVTGLTPAMRTALTENAVYLALKDAHPEGRFTHFLDTNYVKAPLILTEDGVSTAFYFPKNDEEVAQSIKHHASLVRARIVSGEAVIVANATQELSSDVRRLCLVADFSSCR